MASNVVRATLLADAQQFRSGFKDAEQAAGGFETKVANTANVVRGLLAGAAAAAVVKFVDESIEAFSNLEQSTGSVESVFGSAADKITSKARSAADEFGLSMSDFQESASLVGAMLKNQLGVSADEAADKTVNLIAKASDMAATFGGTTADAISAISSLLRGERDPIEQYAVSMNEADIQARALSLGLADSASEVDKNAKAAAALDILFEQTADSAGQFAREADSVAGANQRAAAQLENAKARLGETLQEFDKFKTGIQQTAAEGLSLFAVGIQEMTGQIDGAESAIKRFEISTGASADTLAAAVTINQKYGVAFSDLIPAMNLSRSETEKLTDKQKAFLEQIGYTTDDIAELDRVLAEEHTPSQAEATRAAGDAYIALQNQRSAIDEVKEATEDATTAMREQFDLIDGRLDTFANYTGAVDDQAAAQQGVNDAIAEFGENSPEHLTALEELATANRDVRDAEIAVREEGGLTREEFIKQQTELGLTREQAQLLADKYNELFTPRDVTHTIRFNEIAGNQSSTGRTFRGGRAGGGRVREGDAYRVGEMGEEIFVPDEDGTIIPNHEIRNGLPLGALGGGMGDVIVPIYLDGQLIAEVVRKHNAKYERRNGQL